jgi:hypothetical protein
MIPVPYGKAYLMPVARVMQLYRAHIGTHAISVRADGDLDVVGSRSGPTLYLHVVNTNRERSATAKVMVSEGQVRGSRAFTIADDPTVEVSDLNTESVMQVTERDLPMHKPWEFPAASVTAVEVKLAA